MDQPQEAAATGQETAGQAEQQQQQQPKQQEAAPASQAVTGQGQGDWTKPLDAGKTEGAEEKDLVAEIMPGAPDAGDKKDAAPDAEGEAEADAQPLEVAFPDGFQVDEESMGAFQAIAKEFKLPNEYAQKLADIYVAGQKKQMDLFQSEHVRLTQRIDAEWRREIAEDHEVGGGNYGASRNYAISAIRRFVPEQDQAGFLEFYRNANLANNPHLFKFLVRVGKGTGEAAPMPVASGDISGEGKTGADRMFPNLPSGRI